MARFGHYSGKILWTFHELDLILTIQCRVWDGSIMKSMSQSHICCSSSMLLNLERLSEHLLT